MPEDFGHDLIDVPEPGEVVVVSAATGPVGSTADQVARLVGVRSVAIAGSAEKCCYAIEEPGYADCVNCRNGNLREPPSRVWSSTTTTIGSSDSSVWSDGGSAKEDSAIAKMSRSDRSRHRPRSAASCTVRISARPW